MSTYYNEIDPYAAQWLRNLIKAGHIADGVVDERSIVDVRPNDLKEFTQCHFFAGIGVWSYALRNAGWSDDREVWTGSCPCQPFSAAGAGKGFDDQRHLWPYFYHLIQERNPSVVFGEQVASSDGLTWIDLVQSDMESSQYAFASSDICSAGVGAPHIRQRLYFVASSLADASDDGLQGGLSRWSDSQWEMVNGQIGCHSTVGGLADAKMCRCVNRKVGNKACEECKTNIRGEDERLWDTLIGDNSNHVIGLADANGGDTCPEWEQRSGEQRQQPKDGGCLQNRSPHPTNGFWRDVDWLGCRDDKFRPVRPGSQQMVDGSTPSLGRLRAEDIIEVEKAVSDWSERHQRDGTQAVRDVWDILSQKENEHRTDGGYDSLRETPFLLAFLRQLSDQGWGFPIGNERSSSEKSRTTLRVLRYETRPSYSSRQWGLDEQQYDEFTNPLRLLSQILAHHTEICWGRTGWKNAGSFPLANDEPQRVGRLRAYGNAINAEQAKVFIDAAMHGLLGLDLI